MKEILTEIAIIGAGSAGLSVAYQAASAGADVLVAGNFVFKSPDPIQTIKDLKAL